MGETLGLTYLRAQFRSPYEAGHIVGQIDWLPLNVLTRLAIWCHREREEEKQITTIVQNSISTAIFGEMHMSWSALSMSTTGVCARRNNNFADCTPFCG